MTIYQLKFTNKNMSKDIWDNDVQTLQNGIKILWKFFTFMELEQFFYYFMMTKTPYIPSMK